MFNGRFHLVKRAALQKPATSVAFCRAFSPFERRIRVDPISA